MQKHYHVLHSGFVYEQNTSINLSIRVIWNCPKGVWICGEKGWGGDHGIHNTFNELYSEEDISHSD